MKLSRSFKASSLIESIIAIVLISICSLVALTVYLNVIGQNNPVYYYEAKHTVEKLANEAEKAQDFEDTNYNYSQYTIEKNVTIKEQEHIAIIDYVITSGTKSYTIKKLIKIE
nr:hypothetical protein [uncultured Psychroserpens sp.]